MLNKVYIIWWWHKQIIEENYFKNLESEYISWKIKNSTYWLDITNFFITQYWKDNVINCLIKWKWEYKNIFWYKWYDWNHFELIKELWKNRKNSLVVFHWIYPRILIYSLIPTKHKAWWRHAIIWPYKKINNKIKWIIFYVIQKFFQIFIDTIFYVNETEKNELIRYKYKWNMYFLPIPINTFFWKQWVEKRKTNINKKIITISCIWTVCIRKNQELILKAVNKLKNNFIFKINIIWPWDEEYTYKLKEYIKEKNLKWVVFYWLIDAQKIKDILDDTDIYIQPSFQEWQCQTIMEAWLTWVPLILSDIPTFQDTFLGKTIFFNPNDVNDIADKITYLIQNYQLYNNNSDLINYLDNWAVNNFNKQLYNFNKTYLHYE